MQCLSYSLAWEPITWGPWLKNRISTQTRGCLNVTEVGRSSRRNMYDVITGTLENNSEEGWLWSCLLKQWRERVRVNVPIRGRLIPISEVHESSTPLKGLPISCVADAEDDCVFLGDWEEKLPVVWFWIRYQCLWAFIFSSEAWNNAYLAASSPQQEKKLKGRQGTEISWSNWLEDQNLPRIE